MNVWIKSLSASLLVILLTLCVSVWAAPSVSVPSTPNEAGKILIYGTDVVASSTVTVYFMHHDGPSVELKAKVGADGTFAIEFSPSIVGGYDVEVYDQNEVLIGYGSFGFVR